MKGITEGSGCAGEVSVSDLVQYYFCPRKVYFLRVAELQVPPRSKMRLGTEEHEREHRRIKERRNVYGLAANDVRCVSHNVFTEADCGLYGQIDTLVTLTNGNVVPVEVKYSDRVTIFRQWKKQMTAYAFLLRSLGHRVTYGVIYFPRQKTTVNIPVYSDDLDHILKDVAKVKSLLEGEKMPRGVREEKCTYCEVRKFCVK